MTFSGIKATPMGGQQKSLWIFEPPSTYKIDVDGDGIGDATHETLLASVAKAYCPNHPIHIANQIGFYGPEDTFHRGEVSQWRNALAHVKAGDVINFSMSYDASIMPRENKTLGSLKRLRQEIIQKISQNNSPQVKNTIQRLKSLSRFFESLIKSGIQVYTGAGNEGPGYFNLYGLIPGIQVSGGLNREGHPVSFSGNPDLTTTAEKALWNVVRVPGGVDFTGDGVADLEDKDLSGGPPLVDRFVGKPISDVLATDDEVLDLYDMVSRQDWSNPKVALLHQRLFTAEHLDVMGLLTKEQTQRFESYGPYFALYQGQLIPGFRSIPGPTANAPAQIEYNPEDDPSHPKAIWCVDGTSYSSVIAAAKATSA